MRDPAAPETINIKPTKARRLTRPCFISGSGRRAPASLKTNTRVGGCSVNVKSPSSSDKCRDFERMTAEGAVVSSTMAAFCCVVRSISVTSP